MATVQEETIHSDLFAENNGDYSVKLQNWDTVETAWMCLPQYLGPGCFSALSHSKLCVVVLSTAELWSVETGKAPGRCACSQGGWFSVSPLPLLLAGLALGQRESNLEQFLSYHSFHYLNHISPLWFGLAQPFDELQQVRHTTGDKLNQNIKKSIPTYKTSPKDNYLK